MICLFSQNHFHKNAIGLVSLSVLTTIFNKSYKGNKMTDPTKLDNKIVQGLEALTKTTSHKAVVNLQNKVLKTHNMFIENNKKLCSKKWHAKVKNLFDASFLKYALFNLHLELLWAQSDLKRLSLCKVLDNSIEEMDINADKNLILAFSFESFLFQARAFVDIYMFFICIFLGCIKPDEPMNMSKKRFEKKMIEHEQNEKCVRIQKYFSNRVFGNESWGTILRSLRDKIAHRDMLRLSNKSTEYLFNDELFDWPTIQYMTLDRFFQSIENGIFELIQKTSEILYEKQWSEF